MNTISSKFILAERFTFVPNNNSLVDKENDNETIRLGSNESRILLMLAQHPNEVIRRNELHDFVWRKQGFEVDDSSLTQAISTLRKMLNDSTKSPRYIKTVPKRGYQLIASVEPLPAANQGASDKDEPQAQSEESLTLQEEALIESAHAVAEFEKNSLDVVSAQETVTTTQPPAQKMSWKTKLCFLIAFILPIIAVTYNGPTHSQFRNLTVIDDIPVNTPKNHPDLNSWLPSIELCVKKYRAAHSSEAPPSQVIATNGQDNKMILNYIYPIENSDKNVTLNIVVNQEDLTKVCQ
ncbi:Transcriptional activator CadC [Vibrio ruber DSM 16370]|uniref:Transcriptional activator CadC n=1 Tax=Vibrio ruber (strain DSM 16370 / JCM 11486 / BCRC 17186 / CECT 7878 / LMG 23124 / VR1) TaxID=1123498 RepID=A0A1R4LA12_VIBR1|nr:transcriptional regulator [Vibrio ruber]SJN53269.1 Transcriptional activator CadC [Vibrio ruber DSM 16370]